MAKFTPQDPAKFEESDFDVLPAGQYDFEVTKAEDTHSKAGNDAIKLTLAVFKGDRKYTVWDYLTFTEQSQWKAYSFCKAVGLAKEFKDGELCAFHCSGRTGELKLAIQPAKDQYDEKNVVKSYIAKEEAAPLTKSEADDDIPF